MIVLTWHTPCADMQLKRLIKLNHEIDPNNVGEGQTIVVPVGKLSDRDRLILDGMGQGRYRTYPIRKGEKLEEVLSKRGISMEEFEKLNPGVNPKKVPGMRSTISLRVPVMNCTCSSWPRGSQRLFSTDTCHCLRFCAPWGYLWSLASMHRDLVDVVALHDHE